MIRWLLAPLPVLVAALLAILLAVLYLDRGWTWAIAVVVVIAVLIIGPYAGGRFAFRNRPYRAGLIMEAGLGLLTLGAALAGAVLLWLAIEVAPGDTATTREKQVWAALSAAITAYLGSLLIKPEGEIWNPVKSAIKNVFANDFKDRRTPLERDARDAVQEDSYGASAPAHAGQGVNGWGWDARRLRTRHIQAELNSRNAKASNPPSR